LVFESEMLDGLQGIQPGDLVIVITWLDRDRPNPIGLHEGGNRRDRGCPAPW